MKLATEGVEDAMATAATDLLVEKSRDRSPPPLGIDEMKAKAPPRTATAAAAMTYMTFPLLVAIDWPVVRLIRLRQG